MAQNTGCTKTYWHYGKEQTFCGIPYQSDAHQRRQVYETNKLRQTIELALLKKGSRSDCWRDTVIKGALVVMTSMSKR